VQVQAAELHTGYSNSSFSMLRLAKELKKGVFRTRESCRVVEW